MPSAPTPAVASGSEPFRLPRTIEPEIYHIEIEPDVASATFSGTVADRRHRPRDGRRDRAQCRRAGHQRRRGPDGRRRRRWPCSVSFNDELEQVTFRPADLLPPGPCTISCRFSGTLNDKLRGFYRSTYTGPDGETQTMATTQFESVDARRSFPCFDEPDRKAVFEITLIVERRRRRHLELTRRRGRPGRRQAAHPLRPHHEDVDVSGGLRRRQARDRPRRSTWTACRSGSCARPASSRWPSSPWRSARSRCASSRSTSTSPTPATRSTSSPSPTSPPAPWRTWAASPSATPPCSSTRTRRPGPSSSGWPTSSRTSWPTCGSATSSPWAGGRASGSTRPSPRSWRCSASTPSARRGTAGSASRPPARRPWPSTPCT